MTESGERVLLDLIQEVAKKQIASALRWAKERYTEGSWPRELSASQLGVLCLINERMPFADRPTIGSIGSTFASRTGDDVSQLLKGLELDYEELDNLLYAMRTDYFKIPHVSLTSLNEQYHLFQRAAAEGNLTEINWLLDNGVPVDCRDSKGLTPLHHASRKSQPTYYLIPSCWDTQTLLLGYLSKYKIIF